MQDTTPGAVRELGENKSIITEQYNNVKQKGTKTELWMVSTFSMGLADLQL